MKNEFNTALKNLRKSKGITQEQLAEAVGVSPQAVSKWEINGYPDAPLLPVIADYFDVSLNELFGNEKENVSIGQKVIEHIEKEPKEKRFEAAMEITWAINLAFMGCREYDEYRPCKINPNNPDRPFIDNVPFSEQVLDNGFCQSRQGTSLKYFLLMPEPECGYDNILGYHDKFLELYEFLTLPNALRAMYLFAGRSRDMYFSVNSLVKELDIDKKNAGDIINGMLKLEFVEKASLDTGDGSEAIYHYNANINFISFMVFSYVLLCKPNWYYNQSNQRIAENAFFKHDTYKLQKNPEKTPTEMIKTRLYN